MLWTWSEEAMVNVKRDILNTIDLSGYGIDAVTNAEKVLKCREIFWKEKPEVYDISVPALKSTLEAWIAGRCSAIPIMGSTEENRARIKCWLKQTDKESRRLTPEQVDSALCRLAARAFIQLVDEFDL